MSKRTLIGGTCVALAVGAAVTIALLVPTPSATPPASTPTLIPTTQALDPTQQLSADLQQADLPLLSTATTATPAEQLAYTEEVVATAPCDAAAAGASWSTILDLDTDLPVGPLQYGAMVAIGIRDECPRYLSVVPSGWMPSPTS